jgi:divalent metal cation (Fe/Co/Zn/Cd) transporter
MSKTLRWKKPDCKICRAEFLDVNVDVVLIRPLGHAFSAQLHVVLDQNLTLKEAHKIQQKIKRCCIRKVWNRRSDGDSLS